MYGQIYIYDAFVVFGEYTEYTYDSDVISVVEIINNDV